MITTIVVKIKIYEVEKEEPEKIQG